MKQVSIYICQQCGYQSASWLGKCPECGQWNSLVETLSQSISDQTAKIGKVQAVSLADVESGEKRRISTGFAEFDRVLGGIGGKMGIVLGSVILIAGDPGIGKSTLLLQLALNIASSKFTIDRSQRKKTVNRELSTNSTVLYVAGEESPQQIKIRAERLTPNQKMSPNLAILPETNVDYVIEVIEEIQPRLVIVDSIQTMETESLSGAAGSIGQVRESAARLHRLAKKLGTPVFLVGHVTKEGAVAGPRVVEHLVDAVLYLEGDEFHSYRLLRGVKNRFGSVSEVGIFEMKDAGLQEVDNPSKFFLLNRRIGQPGAVVVPTMSGARPLLTEIQALTTPTPFGLPRRVGTGVDFNRLQMILAVLAKRAKLPLGQQDVYINAAGGLKVVEPAADLAIALAIASAVKNAAIAEKAVVLGEVGLLGEVRSVSMQERRITEAKRLGFTRFVTPDRVHSLEGAIKVAFG